MPKSKMNPYLMHPSKFDSENLETHWQRMPDGTMRFPYLEIDEDFGSSLGRMIRARRAWDREQSKQSDQKTS